MKILNIKKIKKKNNNRINERKKRPTFNNINHKKKII